LSRRKWLAERGLATPIDESESALPEEKVPDEKGKKGRGPSPPVPDQDLQAEAQALAAQQAELQRVLAEADPKRHTNSVASGFVHSHAIVETLLDVEDPYMIIPDEDLDEQLDRDDPKLNALHALGIAGVQKHRDAAVAASRAIWEKELEEAAAAKEQNRVVLGQLLQWQEEHSGMEPKFLESRNAKRQVLLQRKEKHGILKAALASADLSDTAPLQEALQEAMDAAVNTWDATLIENANLKLRYAKAIAEFKVALEMAEKAEQEEPPAEVTEESTVLPDLAEKLAMAKDLFLQCRRGQVPLPSDFGEIALFAKAAELLEEKSTEEDRSEEPAEN